MSGGNSVAASDKTSKLESAIGHVKLRDALLHAFEGVAAAQVKPTCLAPFSVNYPDAIEHSTTQACIFKTVQDRPTVKGALL